MASKPPPAADEAGPDGPAPLRGVDVRLRSLHRPSPLAAVGGRARPPIGAVGRSASRLGTSFLLPGSLRRMALAGGFDLGGLPVRPPDYWAGHEPVEEERSRFAPTGDAAWDRIINTVRGKARAQRTPVSHAQRLQQRGLPSTIHRKGTSVVGPLTAPGAVARRMAVSIIAPAPNPATTKASPARSAPAVAATSQGSGSGPRSRTAATAASRTTRATVRQPASSAPTPRYAKDALPVDLANAQRMLRKLRGEEPPRAEAPAVPAAPPAPPTSTSSSSPPTTSPADVRRSAVASPPPPSPTRAAADRLLRRLRGGVQEPAPVAAPATPLEPTPAAVTAPAAAAVSAETPAPRWWPLDAPATAGADDAWSHDSPSAPDAAPVARRTYPGVLRRLPVAGPSAALAHAGVVPTTAVGPGELRRTAAGLTWVPADDLVHPAFGTAAMPVAAPFVHRATEADVTTAATGATTATTVGRTPAGATASAPMTTAPAPRRTAATSPSANAGRAAAATATSADGTSTASAGSPVGRSVAAGAPAASRTATTRPPASPSAAGSSATPSTAAGAASRGAADAAGSPAPHGAAGPIATPRAGSAAWVAAAAPGSAAGVDGAAAVARSYGAAWPGRLFSDGPKVGPAVTTGHAIVHRLTRLLAAGDAVVASDAPQGMPMAPPATMAARQPTEQAEQAEPVRRSSSPSADPAPLVLGARSVAQQLPGMMRSSAAALRRVAQTPADVGPASSAVPDEVGPPAVVRRRETEAVAPTPVRERGGLRLVHDATAPRSAEARRTPATPPPADVTARPTPGRPPALERTFRPVGLEDPAVAIARLTMAPPAVVARALGTSTPEQAVRAALTPGAATVARRAASANRHVTATTGSPAADTRGQAEPRSAQATATAEEVAVRRSPLDRRPGEVARTPHQVKVAALATFGTTAEHVQATAMATAGPAAPPAMIARAPAAVALSEKATDPTLRPPAHRDTPAAKVERFQAILRQAAPIRPAPLPAPFRPLADRIVGANRAVHISTSEASRQALASVGTTAAATGDVIHLARALDTSSESLSLLAHELTHVAAPSAAPRFHGGAHGAEERRADRNEALVQRAAEAVRGGRDRGPASVGTQGLPVGGPTVVQRSAAKTDEIVQRVTAAVAAQPPASATAHDTRRQSWTAPGHEGGANGTNGSGGDATVRRAPATIARRGGDSGAGASSTDEVLSGPASGGISEAMLAEIVRAVEDRLLEEIERRGGLWRGGF